MAHLPLPSGALLVSTPGAQTAEDQVSSLPPLSAAFHSGVHGAWVSTTPSLARPPQKSATFLVGASLMPTFQASPVMDHHWPPACWASPANQPGSLLEKPPR